MTELKFVVEITQRDLRRCSWEPLPDVGRKIRKTLEIQEREEERTAGQD